MAAIDAFNDKLVAAGQRLLAVGLGSPDSAVVIDARNGAAVETPGPLHTATEFASGIWIVDVPNLETAKQLAAEGSKACNRKVELRQIIG